MKKIIGILMLAALFSAIFWCSATTSSLREAMIQFLLSFVAIGWVYAALYLIKESGKDKDD